MRVMNAKCCIALTAAREAMRHSAREVRKSHCGNSEMGRILPYRLHVKILLLRLMRLLDHQIKPVVIFDGMMPEAKQREIGHRRDYQQEKLWQEDANEDNGGKDGPSGVGGGGA